MNVLHGDEVLPCIHPMVESTNHVRVVNLTGKNGFTIVEEIQKGLVAPDSRANELDRDLLVRVEVYCRVDRTHPAYAELPGQKELTRTAWQRFRRPVVSLPDALRRRDLAGTERLGGHGTTRQLSSANV